MGGGEGLRIKRSSRGKELKTAQPFIICRGRGSVSVCAACKQKTISLWEMCFKARSLVRPVGYILV